MKRKTPLAYLSIISAFLLVSCSKTETQEPTAQSLDRLNVDAATMAAAASSPSNKYFVEYADGKYISTYGGGITFGTSLPHPIDDPTGIYDGYPYDRICQLDHK